ncbi:hypothetical protein BDZ45DRAFT_746278 [Acephala macrosclerotiorum]|nr:hypothetical protein BDZ45DRAFT_746278 [Acephala macrosclerotiorum]
MDKKRNMMHGKGYEQLFMDARKADGLDYSPEFTKLVFLRMPAICMQGADFEPAVSWNLEGYVIFPTKTLKEFGIDVFDAAYKPINANRNEDTDEIPCYGLNTHYSFNRSCKPRCMVSINDMGKKQSEHQGQEAFNSYLPTPALAGIPAFQRQEILRPWVGGQLLFPECRPCVHDCMKRHGYVVQARSIRHAAISVYNPGLLLRCEGTLVSATDCKAQNDPEYDYGYRQGVQQGRRLLAPAINMHIRARCFLLRRTAHAIWCQQKGSSLRCFKNSTKDTSNLSRDNTTAPGILRYAQSEDLDAHALVTMRPPCYHQLDRLETVLSQSSTLDMKVPDARLIDEDLGFLHECKQLATLSVQFSGSPPSVTGQCPDSLHNYRNSFISDLSTCRTTLKREMRARRLVSMAG